MLWQLDINKPPTLIKPRFTTAQILANNLLQEMGNPLPKMPLVDLVASKGWKIVYKELHGPDGLIAKVPTKKGIRFAIFIATDSDNATYSETQIERRQYWTLAHEIGHILLHSEFNLNELDEETAKIMEVEANWFAARLLMPDYIFTEFTDIFPEFLMDKCCVNFTAAQKRLKNLDNFIKDRLVLEGQVRNVVLFPSEHPSKYVEIDEEKQLLGFYDYEIDEVNSQNTTQKVNILPHTNTKRALIPTDDNNRFLFCPRCSHDDFANDARHCIMCGEYLFNYCYREDHWEENTCRAPASGEDRFCRLCGHETYLMSNDYLLTWQEMNEYRKEAASGKEQNHEIIINLESDNLPF